MPRDPHKLMDSPWIWIGHRVVTSQFTHFRVPNLLHSSTRPRCGIRRSDLAIYISCVTESERLVGFFCILGVWFHVSLKSRTLQDPHAAGMSKMDFLFVYFSKLQGGLPRHSRKSLIYCLIKIHLYPLFQAFLRKSLFMKLIGKSHCPENKNNLHMRSKPGRIVFSFEIKTP